MKNLSKNVITVLGITVGIIYAIGVGIFTLLFNWQFANNHGFLQWVFFGEIIATVKAIFWPFIILF